MQESKDALFVSRRRFAAVGAVAGMTGVASVAAGLSAPRRSIAFAEEDGEEEPEQEQETEQEVADVKQWADAVSSASVYTNLYTNLDIAELAEAINSYRCECMFATVNEDGTPNIAVFSGGYVLADEYIIFEWLENQTKLNTQRTKLAMVGYDIVNLDAATKEERHQGAIVKLELVEDDDIRAELAELSPYVSETIPIFRIVEVLPIG